MISPEYIRLPKLIYNNIYIVDDRNAWSSVSAAADPAKDLVLCTDFGLKNQLEAEGYTTEFIDHLVNNRILDPLNFEMHNFLNAWFLDKDGKDLLHYNGYSLGDSLLLFVINEVTYTCHFLINILAIPSLQYKNCIIATENPTILSCLDFAKIRYKKENTTKGSQAVYFFPIIKWIQEKTQRTSLSYKLKNAIANGFDYFFSARDRVMPAKKHYIYIQAYHPTFGILDKLRLNKDIQLILANYSGLKKLTGERRVHYTVYSKNRKLAESMMDEFRKTRNRVWEFDGHKISDLIYSRIETIIQHHLEEALNKADSIENHFRHARLDLMVPITNLWIENRLLMYYCKKHKIPVFMIINGLLNASYLLDAKDSDFVNCYSDSIRQYYFNNSPAAFPLGDPRMDKYARSPKKSINRENPTIIIGSAGYSPIDLNSFLAHEFTYLYDVLTAIRAMVSEGRNAKVVLKVRANGYVHLYQQLIHEYFSDIKVDIEQDASFFDVIQRADLYLSIWSQTIFEAASIGIPTIYYSNNTHEIHPPFDGKSELVSAFTLEELTEKMRAFYTGSSIFDRFLEKSTQEKYIGELSGNNTNNNLRMIYDILEGKQPLVRL